ncbi:ATP-binding protein [Chryseobacterium sp. G0201]|uniref:ATP-binding protein n=1 Tax=Chryseobacterium sp. G0201 TaxID=2487065 RepID=UPI000F510486|nr:AAA family ATPase [Chryseobacterium sp. G0201]AZA54592.1 hypothetical protein EG348_17120 [Chryseobacterium sp. G0201]
MKRIKEITIKNFKAFQSEQVFSIEGKHVLVYGNNGSGKSSLFWALYTFLQSSTKDDDQVQKYFKKYLESDKGTHQTLRNVFVDAKEDSYIKLTSIDTDTQVEQTFTISHDVINTNNPADTLIQELNLASDFINYKLLQNFYRSSHKQEVNLWPVFERDIFPFLMDGANNWLNDIIKKPTLDVPRSPKGAVASRGRKTKYIEGIDALNVRIQNLLSRIAENANNFLKDHFYEGKDVMRVSLSFEGKFNFDLIKTKIWGDRKQSIREEELQIKLTVDVFDEHYPGNWRRIERVHSFLNEAQLTRIAIGIRVGALRNRPLAAAKFKILVLDDMLLSLDLSNRMDVVRIILNKENKDELKFFDGLQKFIFTHDKGFFNLLRRNTNDEEWVYFDFNKVETSNDAPSIKENLTPLQLAIKNFDQNEFENAGNNLRLEAEAILSSFLDPEMKNMGTGFTTLKNKLNEAYNIVSSDSYLKFKQTFIKSEYDIAKIKKIATDFENDDALDAGDKGRLRTYRNRLLNFFIEMNEKNLSKEKVLHDVEEILDRILNPASHHTDNPLHRAELKDAIERIKDLKEHLDQ